MPIFSQQIQSGTFAPYQLVEETIPRPITAADNGKTFLNIATEPLGGPQGTFELPAWGDVPAGFTFYQYRNSPLVGFSSEDSWGGYGFGVGFKPAYGDSIILHGRYEKCVLPVSVGLVGTDTSAFIQVLRADLPNKWLITWEHSNYTSRTIPSDPVSAAFLWDVSYINVPDGVTVQFRTIDGDLLLGAWLNGDGYVQGPDGVSGGPLLPFYVDFHNDNGYAVTIGADHNLEIDFGGPYNGLISDCNWAIFEDGADPFNPLMALVDTSDVVLQPGESMSLYMANFAMDHPYWFYYGDYAEFNVHRHHFYLRQAPGEATPRSWAQASALPPF